MLRSDRLSHKIISSAYDIWHRLLNDISTPWEQFLAFFDQLEEEDPSLVRSQVLVLVERLKKVKDRLWGDLNRLGYDSAYESNPSPRNLLLKFLSQLEDKLASLRRSLDVRELRNLILWLSTSSRKLIRIKDSSDSVVQPLVLRFTNLAKSFSGTMPRSSDPADPFPYNLDYALLPISSHVGSGPLPSVNVFVSDANRTLNLYVHLNQEKGFDARIFPVLERAAEDSKKVVDTSMWKIFDTHDSGPSVSTFLWHVVKIEPIRNTSHNRSSLNRQLKSMFDTAVRSLQSQNIKVNLPLNS